MVLISDTKLSRALNNNASRQSQLNPILNSAGEVPPMYQTGLTADVFIKLSLRPIDVLSEHVRLALGQIWRFLSFWKVIISPKLTA